jgi:hypothetical protein
MLLKKKREEGISGININWFGTITMEPFEIFERLYIN